MKMVGWSVEKKKKMYTRMNELTHEQTVELANRMSKASIG